MRKNVFFQVYAVMDSNSLYNNTFLPEATQCNFEDLKVYGPFQVSYDEPSHTQLRDLHRKVETIITSLLTEEIIDAFCKQIFNYRIKKAVSFVKNLYDFFFILLYQPVKFTYSPQFGITLWPGKLAYVRLPTIETLIQPNVSLLFMDYITETTTFLRYHIKFRFNKKFNSAFRKQFCRKVIKTLLIFSSKIEKMHVMKTGIENALKLIQIHQSRQTIGI